MTGGQCTACGKVINYEPKEVEVPKEVFFSGKLYLCRGCFKRKESVIEKLRMSKR